MQARLRLPERLLTPFSDLVAVSPDAACLGPVSRLLGLVVAAQGRRDEAERLLERAIGQCVELGAPPLVALAQIDYAEQFGEPARAREALATAEELGMARVITRAERILS